MSVVRSSLLFLIIAIITGTLSAVAGTTGKIAGRITEERTGEPVVGASVVVVGKSLGAATDQDGNFVIPNLSPGNYSVAISAVGYRKKIIQNVQVNVDFTTRLVETLSSTEVDLDAVIVTAEKPLVRKDLTSSHTSIDAGQIKTLPVENVAALLSTQAGVIEDAQGNLHFRGGRSHEVAYTVNGVSINNPFTNTNNFSIAPNAIQELSVVQGTFNAEYGNALSGVVETGLKEGGERFAVQFSMYTGDRYSTHDNIFLNINDFNPASHVVTEGTFSGPLQLSDGIPALTFFLSGRIDDEKGWLFGINEHHPSDRPDFTNSLQWNIPKTGDSSLVPMNKRRSYTTTSRFGMKLSGTSKIGYDVVFNESRYQTYSHVFKYNPFGRYHNYDNDVHHALEYSHLFGEHTTFRVKGAYSRNYYAQYRFNDLRTDHYEPVENLSRPIGTTFYFGGSQNGRFEQRAETYSAKLDIASVLSPKNEVKGGVEVRFPQMNQHSFSVLRDTFVFTTATVPPPTNYNNNSYARFPKQFSAYVQDKLEYESIVMNVGVRYDYFIANAKHIADVYRPDDPKVEATAKSMISPRLGISYPITDRGIIHFSYGHFYQMPQLRRLFENPDFEYNPTVSETTFGNANLRPELTITYEMGLQQQVADNLAFTVSGFYKDVRDLFAVQIIRISGEKQFNMYVNKDYGNIKGITFALTKRRTAADLFALSADYTYQQAEGNDVGADAFFIDQQSGRESELVVVPLDWDQQHTLTGTLTVGQPNLWNIGIIGKLGTGLPYTPYSGDNQVPLKRNTGRKPMQTNVDLFADRSFDVAGLTLTLFCKIYNFFDSLNELDVFDDTGRSTYTLAPKRGEGAVIDRNLGKVDGLHSMADYYNNPLLYSSPREVRFGFSLNF